MSTSLYVKNYFTVCQTSAKVSQHGRYVKKFHTVCRKERTNIPVESSDEKSDGHVGDQPEVRQGFVANDRLEGSYE